MLVNPPPVRAYLCGKTAGTYRDGEQSGRSEPHLVYRYIIILTV